MKTNTYIDGNKRGLKSSGSTSKSRVKDLSTNGSKGNRIRNNSMESDEFSYLPELNFGSWIKDNKQGVLGGLMTAGGIASQFFAPGNPIGLQAIGQGASMIGGEVAGDAQAEKEQELIDKATKTQRLNNIVQTRQAGVTPSPFAGSYNQPLFNFGGKLPMINEYIGQSHEGPNGGIPVDQNGTPSSVSGNKPVALTEDGEVSFEGYVFSDDIEFEE